MEHEKTNVYKIEVMVVGHNGLTESDIVFVLENLGHQTDVAATVISVESRSVEWSDSHPLNIRHKAVDAYKELFSTKPAVAKEYTDHDLGEGLSELRAEVARREHAKTLKSLLKSGSKQCVCCGKE
jgi:hypothetical protein